MEKTGIEWTDDTWNPLRGCSLVSDGCKNCYAMGVAGRFNGPGMPYEGLTTKTTQGPKWTGKIMLVPDKLAEPLRKQKPRRIFVNSMSDLFHEDVPEWFIDRVFVTMALAHRHTYQLLTKRPARQRDYLKSFSWDRAVANCANRAGVSAIEGYTMQALLHHFGIQEGLGRERLDKWPLPNVWVGVSVENQATANERVPILLDTPAAIRWLSMEPLLGSVDLRNWIGAMPAIGATTYCDRDDIERCDITGAPVDGIDWVVVGGESGTGARPMHPDWVRDLRDQCAGAEVPFLFKQWGEWVDADNGPDDDHAYAGKEDCWVDLDGAAHNGALGVDFMHGTHPMYRVGKKAAGRLLDGVQHDGYPEVVA